MVLIIEHVEDEGPGLLLHVGDVEICRTWRGDAVPESPRHQALIVLGGPNAAWDAQVQAQVRLLSAFVAAGRPVLGVCLGAQLLARALGARNFRGPALEKGLVRISLTGEGRADPLLGHLDGAEVVEWHADSFDLPPRSIHLASSEQYVHQAFRLGNAWGVQFHIESDQLLRRAWQMPGPKPSAGPDFRWSPGSDDAGLAFAQAFARLL